MATISSILAVGIPLLLFVVFISLPKTLLKRFEQDIKEEKLGGHDSVDIQRMRRELRANVRGLQETQ